MRASLISELRSYSNPPQVVYDVMASVYLLLGMERSQIYVESRNNRCCTSVLISSSSSGTLSSHSLLSVTFIYLSLGVKNVHIDSIFKIKISHSQRTYFRQREPFNSLLLEKNCKKSNRMVYY